MLHEGEMGRPDSAMQARLQDRSRCRAAGFPLK